jgi:vacuolar-type H+-ATPase subunit E/Vma4
MSVAALIATLEKEAAIKSEVIAAEAESAAAQIVADATGEGEKIVAMRRQTLNEQQERRRCIGASEATIARRSKQAVRERAAMEKVKLRIVQQYPAMLQTPLYRKKILTEIVAHCATHGDPVSIVADPVTAPHIQEQFKKTVVTIDPQISPGYRLLFHGDQIIVDATLDARLDAHWPRLLPIIATTLNNEMVGDEL